MDMYPASHDELEYFMVRNRPELIMHATGLATTIVTSGYPFTLNKAIQSVLNSLARATMS